MKRSSLLLCAAVAAGALARAQAVAILEKRCWQCHGESTAMSDLKLTSRENLLRGGSRGAAVSPGNPDASLLYQAVKRTGKLSMPPGPPLPPDEIEILRAWIAGGAEWPAGTAVAKLAKIEWWAFEKPRRPTPPVIAGASTPIDAFVLQKIRAAGIEPASPAGKLTLLRRACYDLLGLPPTAEQIQAFLKDASPQAWEHVVDALLGLRWNEG